MTHPVLVPSGAGGGSVPGLEPLLSPRQVGEYLGVDESTVRKWFAHQPGVLKISMPRLLRNRKHAPRTFLRIPRSVLERLHQERTRGFALGEIQRGRS